MFSSMCDVDAEAVNPVLLLRPNHAFPSVELIDPVIMEKKERIELTVGYSASLLTCVRVACELLLGMDAAILIISELSDKTDKAPDCCCDDFDKNIPLPPLPLL